MEQGVPEEQGTADEPPAPLQGAAGEEATQGPPHPSGPHPRGSDRPVHLYDAVSTQRDHVINAYETQRSAILQAVAEQREAAVAPIRSVQHRKIAQEGSSVSARSLDPRAAGMSPGVAAQASPRQNASAAFTRQQLVAADIAATLRAMIAEEVRSQFSALMDAADRRLAERAVDDGVNAVPSAHDGGCPRS